VLDKNVNILKPLQGKIPEFLWLQRPFHFLNMDIILWNIIKEFYKVKQVRLKKSEISLVSLNCHAFHYSNFNSTHNFEVFSVYRIVSCLK